MIQDSNDRQFWSGSQCGDIRIQTNQTTANIIANQSQDYIDEQLAEFQEQIHRLQGKWLHIIFYIPYFIHEPNVFHFLYSLTSSHIELFNLSTTILDSYLYDLVTNIFCEFSVNSKLFNWFNFKVLYDWENKLSSRK